MLFDVASETILAFDARGWVATDATISSADVEKRTSRYSTSYGPKIEFEFNVGDRHFVGNRFEVPVRRSNDEAYERTRIGSYVVAARTRIYYDPADPTRSVVLRHPVDYGDICAVGVIGLFFLSLGGISIVRMARGSLQ